MLDLLREERNYESKKYNLNSNHKESLDKLKYFYKITCLNSLKMTKEDLKKKNAKTLFQIESLKR